MERGAISSSAVQGIAQDDEDFGACRLKLGIKPPQLGGMCSALHSLIGAYKEEDDMCATAIIMQANLVAGAGRQLKIRSKIANGQRIGVLRVHFAPPDVVVQYSELLIKNNAIVRRLHISLS
jgi:hypothetical protein